MNFVYPIVCAPRLRRCVPVLLLLFTVAGPAEGGTVQPILPDAKQPATRNAEPQMQTSDAKRTRSADGRSVTQVSFGRQGKRLGTFRQIAPLQWREIPAEAGGNRFEFRETGRDDWSVYLHDPSRDVRIQLDLHRKMVLYADAGSPEMRPLYDVLGARAGEVAADAAAKPEATAAPNRRQAAPAASVAPQESPGVDGRRVTRVSFGRDGRKLGTFRQSGPQQWQELPASAGGGRFDFQETGRDDWSVYLHDPSRDVRIQLDLHRKLVLYGDSRTAEMRPLYDILGAGSKPVSAVSTETAARGKPAASAAAVAAPAPQSDGGTPAPAPQSPSAINASGRTVTLADFGSAGRRLGEFRQVGPGFWEERSAGPGGQSFSFSETGRDDWSVYLRDDSRGVTIQIDLFRKLVLYADAGNSTPFPIYDVLAADTPAVPIVAASAPVPVAAAGAPPAGSPAAPQPGGSSPAQLADPASPQPAAAGATQYTESSRTFCWKDSYPRGAGTVPPSCAPGQQRIGLLCYDNCPAGTARSGFDCHSVCPSGMRDDGLFCRATEYGRGAGYPWQPQDGFSDDGMIKRCEKAHGKGNCEKDGAIYYPKCKSGYQAFGCCICRPSKPNCSALGLNAGIDLSCAKRVIIGEPETGTCPSGQEKDGGLCYTNCRAGYDGVGPVCWTGAPGGWVECGMGAAKDSQSCAGVVFDQVSSVGQLAFTIATAGGGSAAGAASKAEKAGRLAELKKKYRALKAAYEKAKPAIDSALYAKQVAGTTSNTVQLMDEEQVTEEDIARISAEIAALVDPTGAAATVAAYTYPKCSKYGFPVP
jgi:hypothetical protein